MQLYKRYVTVSMSRTFNLWKRRAQRAGGEQAFEHHGAWLSPQHGYLETGWVPSDIGSRNLVIFAVPQYE